VILALVFKHGCLPAVRESDQIRVEPGFPISLKREAVFVRVAISASHIVEGVELACELEFFRVELAGELEDGLLERDGALTPL
jgi:hypothetical protein